MTWGAVNELATLQGYRQMIAKTGNPVLVDLLTRPAELARATAEFNERTGGGVGGSKWVAPLLSRDFVPPVDLRWPEYVTTPRGEEWWIPTPNPALGGEGEWT